MRVVKILDLKNIFSVKESLTIEISGSKEQHLRLFILFLLLYRKSSVHSEEPRCNLHAVRMNYFVRQFNIKCVNFKLVYLTRMGAASFKKNHDFRTIFDKSAYSVEPLLFF